MYGLVNRALEEMICARHGAETWDRIKQKAGVDIDIFVRMEAYPDDITYRLVGAACEELAITPADTLCDFGRHWVRYTGQAGYGALFDAAGSTVQEVLASLDDLHSRIGLLYPQLQPPSFKCTEVTDDALVLHYYSKRQGLAPMVIGLLHGVGEHFGKRLEIAQLTSKAQGDDHDSFRIHLA